MRFPIVLFGIVSMFMIAFSGCGKNRVSYVEGTVLYKDAPLSRAIVSFVPEESSPEAKFASGTTDENGAFKLTVRPAGEDDKGVFPGNYIVTVSRYKDEPSRMERIPNGEMVPIFDQLIPVQYSADRTSPLRAVVEKKPVNMFEFRLTE